MTAQPAEPERGKVPDLAMLLRATQVALTDEGVPETTIRRVINRLVYREPGGERVVHRIVDEQAPLIHVHSNDGPAPSLGAHRMLALRYARANGLPLR